MPMNNQYKRIVLKLSGEALKDKNGEIYDPKMLENVGEIISSLVKKGIEIGVVIGGGNIWRGKLASSISMHQANADYMGMLATVMNAMALANAISNKGVKAKVLSSLDIPECGSYYTRERAIRLLDKKVVTIFAGGTGNPYFTTDTCAALRALEIGADVILMAKNGVEGVYTDDPRVNPEAKLIKETTYKEIVDKKLGVMDLTAASMLDGKGIKAYVFNMDEKANFEKIIQGEHIGTFIKE